MMYYSPLRPVLFDSDLFKNLLNGRVFTVLDGGSRGKLFEPFDQVRNHIQVVAFEPDDRELGYAHHHVQHLKYGLWSHRSEQTLHLGKDPSTSSIHPPNIELCDLLFGPRHGTETRVTVKKVKVPCISVDEAVAEGLCATPNFIKLDIHAAEYETLTGARKTLENCVGVFVETWNHPFHFNQHCHGDVESLLNSMGFYIFDFNPNYGYTDSGVYGKKVFGDRKILTSTESIFFRMEVSRELAVFHLACLDLYRYTNLASHICTEYGKKGILTTEESSALHSELSRYPALRKRKYGLLSPQYYERLLRRLFKVVWRDRWSLD